MKLVLIRGLAMFAVAVFAMSHLTACNTMEGAGRDAEAAGEKVQDLADDAKD